MLRIYPPDETTPYWVVYVDAVCERFAVRGATRAEAITRVIQELKSRAYDRKTKIILAEQEITKQRTALSQIETVIKELETKVEEIRN